jgi:hypothetical protein
MHDGGNEKLAFWRGKLQEYRQSGLRRREFYERNRIKKTRLDCILPCGFLRKDS